MSADAIEFEEDVPPAGTACAGCKGLGHWCPAKCYRGEDSALCMACANGVDCSVAAARLKTEEELLAHFDVPSGMCRSIPLPADLSKRVVIDKATVLRNAHGLALQRESGPKPASELVAEPRVELRVKITPARRERYAPEPVLEEDDEPVVKTGEKEEDAMPTGVWVKCTDEEKRIIAESTLGHTELAKSLSRPVKAVEYQRKKLRDGKPPGKCGPRPKTSPSTQLVEIGGHSKGSADSLLNALDKQDQAKTAAAAQSVIVSLAFSPADIRALVSVMTDAQICTLMNRGLLPAILERLA